MERNSQHRHGPEGGRDTIGEGGSSQRPSRNRHVTGEFIIFFCVYVDCRSPADAAIMDPLDTRCATAAAEIPLSRRQRSTSRSIWSWAQNRRPIRYQAGRWAARSARQGARLFAPAHTSGQVHDACKYLNHHPCRAAMVVRGGLAKDGVSTMSFEDATQGPTPRPAQPTSDGLRDGRSDGLASWIRPNGGRPFGARSSFLSMHPMRSAGGFIFETTVKARAIPRVGIHRNPGSNIGSIARRARTRRPRSRSFRSLPRCRPMFAQKLRAGLKTRGVSGTGRAQLLKPGKNLTSSASPFT